MGLLLNINLNWSPSIIQYLDDSTRKITIGNGYCLPQFIKLGKGDTGIYSEDNAEIDEYANIHQEKFEL